MRKRARTIISSVFFVVLSLLLGFCARPKNVTVRIGLQPTDGEYETKELAADLSTRAGVGIEFVVSKSYQHLVELFKNKEIDFAFFTALNFVQAERDAGAKVLLKKVYGNDEFYYSAIVVRNDGKIKKMADLKNKLFGFVDPSSTSGYLYPRMMLKQGGFDAGPGVIAENLLKYEFLGTHEKALVALKSGKVDAVGVWANDPSTKTGAWTNGTFSSQAKHSNLFRVLKYSEPIPNDAFVVRSGYFSQNPDLVFRIMEALIGAGEDPKKILKRTFSVDRMATATSRHYDSVRGLENLVKSQ